ncbi:hypothetical protein [Stackebrandtia soli]|uniref:hypothetical protein n=1 Tax=Stackebrandtia soli TaxID=1892856 RepID=UPI0039EABFAD
MGTDIHGHIECRPEFMDWTRAIDIELLYEGRGYDEFAMLFGVRNDADHVPVAEGRGLPSDVSDEISVDVDGCHGATWIGWDEILTVDWAASAGEPVRRREPTPMSTFDRVIHPGRALGGEQTREAGVNILPPWLRGTEDDALPVPQRSHLLGNILRTFDVMSVLAKQHGAANVRLVVWFD